MPVEVGYHFREEVILLHDIVGHLGALCVGHDGWFGRELWDCLAGLWLWRVVDEEISRGV